MERSADLNPPNPPTTAIYPINGGQAEGTGFVFQWNAATDPDGDAIIDYELQVSEYSDMRWPISSNFDKLNSCTADSGYTRFTMPYPGLLNPDTTYYWHVRARDSHKVWSAWSNTWSFTPKGPTYPINITLDTTTKPGTGTLKWSPNPVGRAPVKYRVYGSDEKGFSVNDSSFRMDVGSTTELGTSVSGGMATFPANFVYETTSTQLDVVGVGLGLPNTNKGYYRVVAVDSNGNRSWSSDFVAAPTPFIYSVPVTAAQVGQSYQYQAATIRSVGDEGYPNAFYNIEHPTYTLTQDPSWLSINANTGLLSGTVGASGGPVTVSVTLAYTQYNWDLGSLGWGQGSLLSTQTITLGPVTQQFTITVGGNQPPTAPANVRDGAGSDIGYTTSTAQLSANWDASTDSDGSVTAYQYAIGSIPGNTDIVNWTTLGNVTTVTKTGLSLNNGQICYFSVKAVDNQGLAGNATNSNGQTVDTTAPGAPGVVRDGTWLDITYTNSATQLSANWDPASDGESGISGYQYAIGTSAGGTQTVNWTTLGNVTTVTKTGLSLTNAQTYYFSVKAVNGAGLSGNATNSNGQTVDSTASGAPANVRDGTGADISTTDSTTQLSANWDPAATDAESGISGYQYAIGTSAGGTQTVNWTPLGNVTTVTKSYLTLTMGQTYFFSVRAVNGAGSAGSATNSNGQTVYVNDPTPPSAPANVRDGTGADISTTSSTTQLSANWDASTDNESGISGYQYAIGTTAGGTQTVNWTWLGNVTTVTKTGLTLSVGQTYYFSVQAVNGVGLTSGTVNSNGQTIVQTIPVTYFSDNFENWTVHGGAWSSVNGESATHMLNTSTDYAMTGNKSLKITSTDSTGSAGAYLRKDFSPGLTGDIYVQFYLFLPTGYATSQATTGGVTRRILRFYTNNGAYAVLSIIVNAAGTSNQLYPQGDNPSNQWDGSQSTYLAENRWHCIQYHLGPPGAPSSTLQCWVDGVSIASWSTTDFAAATSFTYIQWSDVATGSSSHFMPGTSYWDELVISNTYILPEDPTPPIGPSVVRDGTGTDISTTSSTTQLSANWDAATDAETGISGYQYAIGTTTGGTQTVNWTSLGNVTTVTRTGLSLVAGQTYFFSVQAVNGYGLTGSATNSNGQTVQGPDLTPPSHRLRFGTEREWTSPPPVPPRNCRATGTPPPMPRAASADISMPSAPPSAARKP